MFVLQHRDNEQSNCRFLSAHEQVLPCGNAEAGHVQWLCLLTDDEVNLSFYKVCGEIDGS